MCSMARNSNNSEQRFDENDEFSQIENLTTYESIGFMDSPLGVARKLKIATGQCEYRKIVLYWLLIR